MLISWNSTNQCNMFCDHCYRDAGARLDEELTTAQGRQLIKEIARAGFKIMIFSGGEPLMRPDLYELGAYAKEQGLRPVLGTNGTLITAEAAVRLKEAGFMAAAVSLDSMDPGKYDTFRRLEGSHRMALAGIDNLKQAGLGVQINTTVMEWNVGELKEIIDFAEKLKPIGHHMLFLVPTGRAINIEEEALRVVEYEKTIARLMEIQKTTKMEIKPTCAPQFMRVADKKGVPVRFNRGCLAGISYCIISPRGDVQPCAYLNIPLGNVKEQPFDEIWRNNAVLNELRTCAYKGKCGVCDYRDRCGGCRARAYYYSGGDYMAEDEWCLYHPAGGPY